GERHAGVQRLVGEVGVSAAVDLVGSAARREVEETAAHLAELGGKIGGLQGELLDRFHGGLRLVGGAAVEAVVRFLAFEQNAEGSGGQAVHLDRVPAGDGRARG